MAEFSWGGLGVADLAVGLLFLGPLYGCAAILIREVARRTGRGWPTILILALAFGVLQPGLVDQSLFNPAYSHYDFQHSAHVGWIHISAIYFLSFAIGHVVSSIAVPLALIEACNPRRPREPWLGRTGLIVVAMLYALGTVVNHLGVKNEEEQGFQAEPLQMAFAATLVLVLIVLAFRLRPVRAKPLRAPHPALLAVGALIVWQVWMPLPNWYGVGVAIGVVVAVCWLVACWSQSSEWSAWHVFALAAGAALSGGVSAFLGEPYVDMSASAELLNDSVAAIVPMVLVAFGWWRMSSASPSPGEITDGV